MDENVDIEKLVHDLAQEDESTRKMAAFKLQNLIGDPSFADVFIANGGVPTLRFLALRAHGNTLAYSLASLSNLLNLDQGWDWMTAELVQRLTNLVISQPLVNISRGAMAILAAIVSHPSDSDEPGKFGFAALKPALDAYPAFLDTLASRLSSADHSLCYNALQLLNAILRDSMTNDSTEHEWAALWKRYGDLGVITAVNALMQDGAVQDLAHSLVDFQTLTKQLLRKWKATPVDPDNNKQRKQLKSVLHVSKTHSHSKHASTSKTEGTDEITDTTTESEDPKKKYRDPERWRRIGFSSEHPVGEFEDTGLLGLRDLNTFATDSSDNFQRILQEQSSLTAEERCPIARASLAMTGILYDHFEIDELDDEEGNQHVALESRETLDKLFKPLMLRWQRLHIAGIQAFVRLWATAGARQEDFDKIEELVRILIEEAAGVAPQGKDIQSVEGYIATYELSKLREDQMALLELTWEEGYGHQLRQVKSELQSEALQFVREQRIRCLQKGAWFPNPNPQTHVTTSWRFAKVSQNRKYLHYDDFDSQTPVGEPPPAIESLEYKLDLDLVTMVVSDVIAGSPGDERSSMSMHTSTTKEGSSKNAVGPKTEITILGELPPDSTSTETKARHKKHTRKPSSRSKVSSRTPTDEHKLLTLHPKSQTLASEWLDGLFFILGEPPITNETAKLVEFIAKYGLKIRLLNVRFDEEAGGKGGIYADVKERKEVRPNREGVDDEFFYEVEVSEG